MSHGYRVIVPFNGGTGQPILEAGDLFNKFLAKVSKMWQFFPVDARSWDKVLDGNKMTVWRDYVVV